MSLAIIERHGEVTVIQINYPPVNAMGLGVPRAIIDALAAANSDETVQAIVLAGGGRGIIAGADIRRQGKPWPDGEATLRDAISALESSSKPVVACLQGATLGGGLELVMGCNYRVATSAAQVGQPEVKLGIPPGAGGTQRLPRLAGVATALDMIVSGEPVDAARALELGIVDSLVGDRPIDEAVTFIRARAAESTTHPRARDNEAVLDDSELFARARTMAARKSAGQRAPMVCIDCVEAATRLPFDEGIGYERKLFDECVVSPEAAAMRHQFFAERAARRIPGVAKDTAPLPVRRAAIVGAGTMGGGIAMCFASAGIPVTVIENDEGALSRGLERVRDNYQRSVKSGRLRAEDVAAALSRIDSGTDLSLARDADLVIEAVFEEMDLKKQVFAELDRHCGADTIVATNTSYLNVDEIAATLPARRHRILGMHFFSPANIMRLLEIVRAEHADATTLQTALTVGQKLGKLSVVAGVCHGFIGNRMLEYYRRQADFLLEEGATPQQIDGALTDFGMAMGPLAVADLAGLDISYRKRKANAHLRDPAKRDSDLIDRLCELGRHGQKTGSGYYRYESGNRKPIPDPQVQSLIEAAASDRGIARRVIETDEIIERCLYALVNEGARILDEGIAARASDIDLVYSNGYGFPKWRGGPMFWAQHIGLANVLARIREFAADHDYWEPAPLLVKLVDENRDFSAFDAAVDQR